NATGNEWEVPIRLAEVFVKVPPGVADDAVRAVAYSGPRGSGGQDYTLDRVERFWRFSTTRGLRPREGLTVVVGWPPGYIGRPSAMRHALWFVGDNWPLELFVLAKIFGADWTLSTFTLSEIRRDYDRTFPPIRDRLYRLMVENGLFPASPGRMRADWLIPGGALVAVAFVLPQWWPSWLDAYGVILPVAIAA